MANEYATLPELKAALRITNSADDAELSAKLTSASRRVDDDTGRRFWQDAGTSSRIYRANHEELLQVDDISTMTGLVVEVGRGTSWSTVDANSYDTLPENALADGWAIETLSRVNSVWPLYPYTSTRVRVTARWGWPTVPEPIKNATILLGSRVFRRKDSPEGLKGFSDLGVVRVSRYDSDYDGFIGRYVRDVK